MREDLPDLAAGIWRHYKGPLYQVFGYAHDANVMSGTTYDVGDIGTWSNEAHEWLALEERFVVVYMALQLDGAHTGPRMAVRTASDFWTAVCGLRDCPQYGLPFEPDAFGGCIRCKDAPTPRFTYVGTVWEGDGG